MPRTSAWRRNCCPALADEGIHILPLLTNSTPSNWQVCKRYFRGDHFPGPHAAGVRPGRPFPHISNLSLNLAVLIRDAGGDERFARVKVPDSLPALVPLTRSHKSASKRSRARRKESYVWIEEVIAANLDALFPGMEIVEAHPFHVTRDADIAIKELEADDLLETIEEGVRQRKFGSVVRLQVNQEMPQHILQILMTNLEVEAGEVYRGKGLLGLSRLVAVAQIDRPDLKYKPFLPASPPELQARHRRRGSLHASSAGATSCCIIRSNPFSRWSISCARRRAIPTCWRSRWCSTAWAAIRRWWRRCWRPSRKASRWRC